MKPTTTTVTDRLDLTGRIAIVTGASSGIGKECARVFALRGARVILACRNEAKTNAVIREFADTIGREAASRCEFRLCDTASMRTVRALADAVAADGQKIDFVLLNAGVFGQPFRLTEDGFESTLATNYIGHFLLVHLLLSHSALARDARIVATQTSGILNPFAKADLEMLASPAANQRRYSRGMSSPNSKVLLALMMQEFTRRKQGTAYAGVAFNAGDPGATLTDNVNQVGAVLGAISKALAPLVMKPVEQGAAVLVWATTSPQIAGASGRLFNHKLRPARLPARCSDPAIAHRAWDVTESILGLAPWPPA